MKADAINAEQPVCSISKLDNTPVSVKQVAAEKGVTPHAVYQMMYRGKLKARKMGSTIYFLRSDISEYLNN